MAVSFDFRRRLGSGYFGEVWHAIDVGLGCEVALKCIPPDKLINEKNFYQEAQVLKASEHPNIVRVNETGKLNDGRIYVSMEYLPNGSLEDEAQGAFVALSRAKRVMIDVLLRWHMHTNRESFIVISNQQIFSLVTLTKASCLILVLRCPTSGTWIWRI